LLKDYFKKENRKNPNWHKGIAEVGKARDPGRCRMER
jgi:hypothetical protein